MQSWGQGYVTDVDYIHGFYRDLSPSYLRLICRLQGIVEPPSPVVYLELGCGQGFALNVLAATNPADNFIGVDFLPSQVVGARRLAAQAQLPNVRFLENSFDELLDGAADVPECDIIAMHGVYSWVSPMQRRAIRELIRKRLKPGGLVYVSYNCMVGWGAMAAFQRALRDIAISRGGTLANTGSALQTIKQLRASGMEYFCNNPAVERLLDEIDKKDARYLVHEYMNEHWTPYYFQDLAREFEECKLTFVGSATAADNVDKFAVPPESAPHIRAEPDPYIREFLRDLAVGRRFRKDIFMRGAVRLEQEEHIASLRRTRFTLVKPHQEIEPKAPVPLGFLELRRPIYGQALDSLAKGPRPLAEVAPDPTALHELITVLMQTAAIHPTVDDGADGAAAARLNRALTASPAALGRYGFAAAPLIGSGIPIEPRDRIALSLVAHGATEEAELATSVDRLAKDPAYAGLVDPSSDLIATAPPELDPAALGRRLTLWRQLGMLASLKATRRPGTS